MNKPRKMFFKLLFFLKVLKYFKLNLFFSKIRGSVSDVARPLSYKIKTT